MTTLPSLAEVLLAGRRRALHLELRDTYERTREFESWRAGEPPEARAESDAHWHSMLAPLLSRGADLRRMRVVSEPVTEYIRYEYEATPESNLAAGEKVRWLSREHASGLRFPGNDFWLVDDTLLFNLIGGDGDWLGTQRCDDGDVVAFCVESFEAAWARGVDHAAYRPA